jgi:hypothetical protein
VPVTFDNSSAPGSRDCRPSTAIATTSVNPKRVKSAKTIAFLRSTRSVITPAGSVKIIHGRRCTSATPAISSGLRVSAEASHG